MVDATPFGELVRQRRENLRLSFGAAGALVGMVGNTWQAHEQNYRVVDDRMVERRRATPYTDALMSLAVGITDAELDAIGRPDAAQALRSIVAGNKAVDVTGFHVAWLCELYDQAASEGEFWDQLLSMVRRAKKRPKRRPT